MTDTITVKNQLRDMPVLIYDKDGNAVQLPPGVTQEVETRFGWNLPAHVKLVGSKAVPTMQRPDITATPLKG